MKKIVLTLICVISVLSIPLYGFATEQGMIIQQPVYDYKNGTVAISGESSAAGFVALQILNKGYTFDDISNFETDNSKFLYRGQETASDGKFTFNVTFNCTETDDYQARLVTNTGEIKDFSLRLIPENVYSLACDALTAEVNENDFEGFCDVVQNKAEDLGFIYTIEGVAAEDALKPYFDYLKKNPLDKDKYDDNVRTYNGYIIYNGLSNRLIENIDSEIELINFTTEKLVADYRSICGDDAASAMERKQKYFTEKLSGQAIDGQKEFEKVWKQALILTVTKYADGPELIYNTVSDYDDVLDKTLSAPTMAICRGLAGNDYSIASFEEAYKKLSAKNSEGGNKGGSGGSGGGGGRNTMAGGVFEQTETQTDTAVPLKVSFDDIEGVDWATEAILALADKGVICGVEPGMFKPNQNITREEFVKILLGAMGYDEGDATSNAFSDVSEDDWFYSWVNIAAEKGIVKGIGDGMFGAGLQISRQDMAVMICNALRYSGNTLTASEFVFGDDNAIAEYAKASVYELYKLGAINGKTETAFEPVSFATRAEAAKIIYNVWTLLEV